MVAAGEQGRVLALLDPDSDLLERLRETGRCVVQLLSWPDRQLAEAFAGTSPAPGGPFRQADFTDTAWGPRLGSATTWAGTVPARGDAGGLVGAGHLRPGAGGDR